MGRMFLAALVMTCAGLSGAARADGQSDPTGTWKWTVHHGDSKHEVTVKLQLEGSRLTGLMVGKGGHDTKVEDGTFKNGEVSFNVPGKTADGKDMMHKFSGRLEGDTIKGKVVIERPDGTRTGSWEAKRSKD
jgi:hypothetical protein